MSMFIPLWCLLVSAGGLAVSIAFYTMADSNLQNVITSLHLATSLENYSKDVSIALFVVFPVIVLCLCICLALKTKQKSKLIALVNGFAWLTLVFVVVYACLISIWTIGSYACFQGSGEVISNIQPYWDKITNFYNNAIGIAQNMSSAIEQTLLTPSLPSQYSAFLNVIDNAFGRIEDKLNGTCPIVCLNLNGVSWLQPGNNCICNLTRLETAQGYFDSAWHNFAYTLIGVFLMFFGLSWLLMYASSSYTASKMKQPDLLITHSVPENNVETH